jgi:hypothetical protein
MRRESTIALKARTSSSSSSHRSLVVSLASAICKIAEGNKDLVGASPFPRRGGSVIVAADARFRPVLSVA